MTPTAVPHAFAITAAALPRKAEEGTCSKSSSSAAESAAAIATSVAVPAVLPAEPSCSPTLSLILSLMGMLGHHEEVKQVAQLNKELYYDEDIWDSINSYPILYGAFCAKNPTRLDFLSKRRMSHKERLKGNFDCVMQCHYFGELYILAKMNAYISDTILYDNQTHKEIGRQWKLRQEIETHRFNVVRFLCKYGMPLTGAILNRAVSYKNYALVDFLCQQGAPLNVRQQYDRKTPLHIAIEQYLQYSDTPSAHSTHLPILRSLFKRMKNLSKEETGINLQMTDGSTALHLVLLTKSRCNFDICYRIHIVKALCKLQIDTTLITDKGQTAYDIARRHYGADSDIATLLEMYPHS